VRELTDPDDNRSTWWDGQRSSRAHRRRLRCDMTAILSHLASLGQPPVFGTASRFGTAYLHP
jgi:hypothetical protein